MSKLIAALVLAGLALAACDVSSDAATTSPTPRPSASGAVAASSAPATPAVTAAPTAAPATPVRTAPPPPPPVQAAPSIKPVPARGVRGTSFVFQFTGFPTSPRGLDIIQTVTLPTGVKLAPKTFTANPDGTGLTTYTPNVSDPSGQYVVTLQVAGGGVSSFAIIIVD